MPWTFPHRPSLQGIASPCIMLQTSWDAAQQCALHDWIKDFPPSVIPCAERLYRDPSPTKDLKRKSWAVSEGLVTCRPENLFYPIISVFLLVVLCSRLGWGGIVSCASPCLNKATILFCVYTCILTAYSHFRCGWWSRHPQRHGGGNLWKNTTEGIALQRRPRHLRL